MIREFLSQCSIDVLNLMRMENPFSGSYLVEDINYGWCHDWAWIVCNKLPHSKWYTWGDIDHGHSFVKIGGLYYDAWDLYGVKDWTKLTYFSIHDLYPEHCEIFLDYDHFIRSKIASSRYAKNSWSYDPRKAC